MNVIPGVMIVISAVVVASGAAAQTIYPEKSIRVIVGLPPGGQPDNIARLLGQKFSESMGKAVVVENVTGAGGTIAADRVAKAAPDGYTLALQGQSQLVVNPSLYRLPYDPLKDFAPISQIVTYGNIVAVHSALPAKSVKELVALAKAQPGALTFASSGNGSGPHLAGELFKSMARVDIRHIPYKGVPEAMPDLLSGRVAIVFSPVVVVLPALREAKLRGLAVTSLRRSSVVPELPTAAESGFPTFEYTTWVGLLAPAATPATIVGKLHLETVKALTLPDVRAKLADLGLETLGNSPAEFAAVMKAEVPRWAKVIRDAGIKAE